MILNYVLTVPARQYLKIVFSKIALQPKLYVLQSVLIHRAQ